MKGSAERVWYLADELAERFRVPVYTIRQRIRIGNELPEHPQAIRAKNFGTAKCPRYRIHAREVARLES